MKLERVMRYTSPFRLLGVPLIDIQLFNRETRGVARGWIAVGDISFGYLLSVGGIAGGGIALGGVSVGLLSVGGLALGLLALGGAAFAGLWGVGGLSIAGHAAVGGLAVASSYAQGGAAVARHANDVLAAAFLTSHPFFTAARALAAYSRWALLLLLICVLPLFLNRRKAA